MQKLVSRSTVYNNGRWILDSDPITTKRPVPWPISWRGSPGPSGPTTAHLMAITAWARRPDRTILVPTTGCVETTAVMADEVGPALSKADNKLGYQSRCSDRPSTCGFHKGSDGKRPNRSRIYDRNRSSDCSTSTVESTTCGRRPYTDC